MSSLVPTKTRSLSSLLPLLHRVREQRLRRLRHREVLARQETHCSHCPQSQRDARNRTQRLLHRCGPVRVRRPASGVLAPVVAERHRIRAVLRMDEELPAGGDALAGEVGHCYSIVVTYRSQIQLSGTADSVNGSIRADTTPGTLVGRASDLSNMSKSTRATSTSPRGGIRKAYAKCIASTVPKRSSTCGREPLSPSH